MKEIGDHLGHGITATTSIYAKVNMEASSRGRCI
ncbi:hypothetical protein [Mesorhizobium sp. M0909]